MKVDVETSPTILAQVPGRCPECNAAIRKDDPIVEVKATKVWVHPECIPVEIQLSKTTTEAGLTASGGTST